MQIRYFHLPCMEIDLLKCGKKTSRELQRYSIFAERGYFYRVHIKFGLFEKGTNFKWKIVSNFVPFSKSPNFKKEAAVAQNCVPLFQRRIWF